MQLNLRQNEEQAVNEFKDRLLNELGSDVRAIILFGSKARGEDSPDSDIDILLVVKNDSRHIWDKAHELSSAVSLAYDVLLSVKIIEVSYLEFLKSVDSLFIANVEKDGASIWKAA